MMKTMAFLLLALLLIAPLCAGASGVRTMPASMAGPFDVQGALTGLAPLGFVAGGDMTLSPSQCRGALIVVWSGNRIIIPAGLTAGASFAVRVQGAYVAKIVPPPGGRFDLNGTLTTADYVLSSTGATGDEVSIIFNGFNFIVSPSPGCPWTAGVN